VSSSPTVPVGSFLCSLPEPAFLNSTLNTQHSELLTANCPQNQPHPIKKRPLSKRLLRGTHKVKFIKLVKDYRDYFENMCSKYPPLVAAKTPAPAMVRS